ncbi:hypothetical protein ACNSPU_19400 [Bacillus velezensis]
MKFVLKYRSKIILAVVSVFLFSILGTTAAEAAESPNNQSLVRDNNLEKEFSSLLSSQKSIIRN